MPHHSQPFTNHCMQKLLHAMVSLMLAFGFLQPVWSVQAQPAALPWGPADPAYLVKDIFPGSGPAQPIALKELTRAGSLTFFIGHDPIDGQELWKTDGTLEGTEIVKDLNPGPADSAISGLVGLAGRVVFWVKTPPPGSEQLWQSDGTLAGTYLLHDFGDNSAGVSIQDGSWVFFAVFNGNSDELWKTDGTRAGTMVVKTIPINHGPGGISQMAGQGDSLYITVNDAQGFSLWKSDGTDVGTVIVVARKGSAAQGLADLNGTAIFTRGGEIWKSDGTPQGSGIVYDTHEYGLFSVGTGPSFENAIFTTGNQAFLFMRSVEGVNAVEKLWRTDGTPGGTVNLPGSYDEYSELYWIGRLGNTVFYEMANDGFFRSDGTAAGTSMIDLSGPGMVIGFPRGCVQNNRLILFGMDYPTQTDPNATLWSSDGTLAGSSKIHQWQAGSSHGTYIHVCDQQNAYFVVNETSSGEALWKTDGTAAGTVLVKSFNDSPPQDSSPSTPVSIGTKALFSAAGPGTGRELWASDASAGGTSLVKDIRPGTDGSDPQELTRVGSLVFFTADDGSHGRDVWRSDGTEAGTLLVSGDTASTSTFLHPNSLVERNGALFFLKNNQLWTSDGTSAGTQSVSQKFYVDLSTADYSPNIFRLIKMDGNLYFVQAKYYPFGGDPDSDGTFYEWDFWKYNGQNNLTNILPNSFPSIGFTSSYAPESYLPKNFTTMDGSLFYLFKGSLWRFGPTDSNPVSLTPIDIGEQSDLNARMSLTVFQHRMIFPACDRINCALWASDGTVSGTIKLVEAAGGTALPQEVTLAGSQVFFSMDDGVHGRELWKTDGTPAGTALFKDLLPGPSGSNPQHFYFLPAQNRMLFSADGAWSGKELWETDGSSQGTVLLQDLLPGAYSSSPSGFGVMDSAVLFNAVQPDSGRELWALPLAGLSAPVAADLRLTLDLQKESQIGGLLPATDMDQHALVYHVLAQPAHGQVVVDPESGSFTYTQQSNQVGKDQFSFWADDGTQASAVGTVYITLIYDPKLYLPLVK
jgi:trimeric autotransporter adhesin